MMKEFNLINTYFHTMSHALVKVKNLYDSHMIVENNYQKEVEIEYQKMLLAWCEVKNLLAKINKVRGIDESID